MTEVPSYTKVLTLGARGTERALIGPVVVQENKLYIGAITRTAVRGLAEWYKAQLFSRQLLEGTDASTD